MGIDENSEKSSLRTFMGGRIVRFNERLKEAIGDDSNTFFALKCELSEKTIRKYLKGEALPTMESLLALSFVSGKSVEWLACGTTETESQALQEKVITPDHMLNKWIDVFNSMSDKDRKKALNNIMANGYNMLLNKSINEKSDNSKPLEINASNIKELTTELIRKLNYDELTEVIKIAREAVVVKAIESKPKTKTA